MTSFNANVNITGNAASLAAAVDAFKLSMRGMGVAIDNTIATAVRYNKKGEETAFTISAVSKQGDKLSQTFSRIANKAGQLPATFDLASQSLSKLKREMAAPMFLKSATRATDGLFQSIMSQVTIDPKRIAEYRAKINQLKEVLKSVPNPERQMNRWITETRAGNIAGPDSKRGQAQSIMAQLDAMMGVDKSNFRSNRTELWAKERAKREYEAVLKGLVLPPGIMSELQKKASGIMQQLQRALDSGLYSARDFRSAKAGSNDPRLAPLKAIFTKFKQAVDQAVSQDLRDTNATQAKAMVRQMMQARINALQLDPDLRAEAERRIKTAQEQLMKAVNSGSFTSGDVRASATGGGPSKLALAFTNLNKQMESVSKEQADRTGKKASQAYATSFTNSFAASLQGKISATLHPKIASRLTNDLHKAYEQINKEIASKQLTPAQVNTARSGLVTDPQLSKLSRLLIHAQNLINQANTMKSPGRSGSGYESGTLNELILSWNSMGRLLSVQLLHTMIGKATSAMIEGTKAAVEYQKKITQIRTIAQDSQQSFDQWSSSVANVAKAFGINQIEAATAAYEALSNQVARGAEVEGFLRGIAIFSKVTASSLAESGNLMASVLNSYKLSAADATRVSAIMFKTIDLGRVMASEMSNTFGRVAVLASEAGVSLEELGAMISLLTIKGTKYNEAYTLINNLLLKLVKPTSEMEKYVKSLGYSTGFAAIKGMGFVGFLNQLNKDLETTPSLLTDVFNEMRSLRGAFSFTGQGLSEFQNIFAKFGLAQKDYAAAIAMLLESPGERLSKESERLKTYFSVDVGSDMLVKIDALTNAFGGLYKIVRIGLPTAAFMAGANILMMTAKTMRSNLGALYKDIQMVRKGMGTPFEIKEARERISAAKHMAGLAALQLALAGAAAYFTYLAQRADFAYEKIYEKNARLADAIVNRSTESTQKVSRNLQKMLAEMSAYAARSAAEVQRGLANALTANAKYAEDVRTRMTAALNFEEKAIGRSFTERNKIRSRYEREASSASSFAENTTLETQFRQINFRFKKSPEDRAKLNAALKDLQTEMTRALEQGNFNLFSKLAGTGDNLRERFQSTLESVVSKSDEAVESAKQQLAQLDAIEKMYGRFAEAEQVRKTLQDQINQATKAKVDAEAEIVKLQKEQLENAQKLSEQANEYAKKQEAKAQDLQQKEDSRRLDFELLKKRIDEFIGFKLDGEKPGEFQSSFEAGKKKAENVMKQLATLGINPESETSKLVKERLATLTQEVQLKQAAFDLSVKQANLDREKQELDATITKAQADQAKNIATQIQALDELQASLGAIRRTGLLSNAKSIDPILANIDSAKLLNPGKEQNKIITQIMQDSRKFLTSTRNSKDRADDLSRSEGWSGTLGAYGSMTSWLTSKTDEYSKKAEDALMMLGKSNALGGKAGADMTAAQAKAEKLKGEQQEFADALQAASKNFGDKLLTNSDTTNQYLKRIQDILSNNGMPQAKPFENKPGPQQSERNFDPAKNYQDQQLKYILSPEVQTWVHRQNNLRDAYAKAYKEFERVNPPPVQRRFWGGYGSDTQLTAITPNEMVINPQMSKTLRHAVSGMQLARPDSKMTGSVSVGDINITIPGSGQNAETLAMQIGQILRDKIQRGALSFNT